MIKIYTSCGFKLLLLCFAFVITQNRCQAQAWTAAGAGINGQINTMAVYNNQLYAAGDFDSTGTTPANYIVVWDNGSWQPVGQGIIPVANSENSINALAVYNNELYAVGLFDSISGASTKNIARWNGTAWAAVAPAIPAAYCMIVYNNGLYIGGGFDSVAGIAAHGIARWDGSAWHDVGGGVSAGGIVLGFTVYNNQLIAAGSFATAGSNQTRVNNIAAWNGTTWSPVGNGIGDSTDYVYSLTPYNGGLAVGGDFNQAGGTTFTRNVALWDGANWSALGLGVGTNSDSEYVLTLATYNGNLIAGGYFDAINAIDPAGSIAQWNGTTWSSLGLGVNIPGYGAGIVQSLNVVNNNLFVGGDFTVAGDVDANSLAIWSAPTNIEQVKAGNHCVISPNPANNFISISNLQPGVPIIVTDLLGQQIIKTTNTGAAPMLNISALSPGMYFVNGVKFVKE